MTRFEQINKDKLNELAQLKKIWIPPKDKQKEDKVRKIQPTDAVRIYKKRIGRKKAAEIEYEFKIVMEDGSVSSELTVLYS